MSRKACPERRRRDAKAAKFGVCNENHSKGYHLFSLNLAPLRLGGINFRIRVSSAAESFAQAAQILNYSNTKYPKGSDDQTPNFVLFVPSFENTLSGHNTLTLPSPASGRGFTSGTPWIKKSPRPFRWERARVRAISLLVGERKLMNHFVVKFLLLL